MAHLTAPTGTNHCACGQFSFVAGPFSGSCPTCAAAPRGLSRVAVPEHDRPAAERDAAIEAIYRSTRATAPPAGRYAPPGAAALGALLAERRVDRRAIRRLLALGEALAREAEAAETAETAETAESAPGAGAPEAVSALAGLWNTELRALARRPGRGRVAALDEDEANAHHVVLGTCGRCGRLVPFARLRCDRCPERAALRRPPPPPDWRGIEARARDPWGHLAALPHPRSAEWERQAPLRDEVRVGWERQRAEEEAAVGAAAAERWAACRADGRSGYAPSAPLAGSGGEERLVRLLARLDRAPFDQRCVLSGSPVSFGVELEFVGELPAVATALYAAGLAVSPVPRESGEGNAATGWTVKPDSTVHGGGGEVTSPVLYDDPDSWRALQEVCRLLRACDCRVDRSCGTHLHFGRRRLGAGVTGLGRLWDWTRWSEDLLYRLGSSGYGLDGEVAGQRGTAWARPIVTGRIGYRWLDGTGAVLNEASIMAALAADRVDALSFAKIGPPQDTVEFRHPNGTLSPLRVQALVGVYAALLELAAAGDPSGPPLPLGAGMTDPMAAEARARAFFDLAFPTNRRSFLRALWLYQHGRWQPADAGAADAGAADAGAADAGAADAGAADAGAADAGAVDAGAVDAGAVDGGTTGPPATVGSVGDGSVGAGGGALTGA